jgi:hypothetical protein
MIVYLTIKVDNQQQKEEIIILLVVLKDQSLKLSQLALLRYKQLLLIPFHSPYLTPI